MWAGEAANLGLEREGSEAQVGKHVRGELIKKLELQNKGEWNLKRGAGKTNM